MARDETCRVNVRVRLARSDAGGGQRSDVSTYTTYSHCARHIHSSSLGPASDPIASVSPASDAS
eukprot:7386180-Prymnesium_polylepis.1